MVELAIQVKLSAFKMGQREAIRKIWWTKFWLAVAVVFYGALNLLEELDNYYIIFNYSSSKEWQRRLGDSITPAVYFSISIGLVTASIYLLVNMHKYFEVQLKDEARRIRVIFLMLTVSYVSRAVVYLLAGVWITNTWMVYLVMYNLWDILPLSLIMYYHNTNFNEQEKTKKRERVIQEREEQTTQTRVN